MRNTGEIIRGMSLNIVNVDGKNTVHSIEVKAY